MTKINPAYIVGVVIILAVFRFVPHPPNATPIIAMALFSGAAFSNRLLAYLVPIAAMLLSDMVIGFHSTIGYVYFGIIITVFMGNALKQLSILRVGAIAIISSLFFFFITNFGSWLHHNMYPQNFNGLVQAYFAGLPFLRNSLVANLIFSYLVFFGFKNLLPSRPLLES